MPTDNAPANATAPSTDSLLGSLEQDYTQQAQADAAQERAALHALLKDPLPETVPVYERNLFSTLSLLGFGILFLFFGIVQVNNIIKFDYEKFEGNNATAIVFFFGASALILWRLYRLFANWKTPLFTLSLTGVQFRGCAGLIPWKQVHNYQVHITTYYGFITISARVDFDLAPNQPVEWPAKKPVGVKYKPKKARIRASGIGVSPRSKKLAELIGNYRVQSHALDRLELLGDGQ